jgi:hypothetical protein
VKVKRHISEHRLRVYVAVVVTVTLVVLLLQVYAGIHS